MENLKEIVLEYIENHPKKNRRVDDILSALGMTSSSDFVKVSQALSELERELLLFRADDNQYLTQKQAGVMTGRISINRSGLGFVDREDRDSIKIDPTDQNTALDGDTVLVRCKPWETYGEVLRVITRAKDFIIGTFLPRGKRLKFIPDDEKLQDKLITVKYDQDFLPVEGMKVLCRIQKYGTAIVVYVERVIGYKDDPGVDILAILLDHDIDPKFPEAVMEEVKTIPQEIQEIDKKDRVDLTGETIVTIDGDDSKDFDDAVSVTPVENGWVLKVSIADVSHYVTEGSALDKEALARGCSTYVTDRVVPMLPHELSNGICSLNPYVERLTITCQMNVNHSGKIEEYSIYPSMIRSTERMTYANVNKILDGDEKLQEEYKHLGNLFFDLRDCADAIRANRTAKGAIDFDGTETVVEVDEKGRPIDVHARMSGHAERMIEDCMIAANVSVANYMKWLDVPSIYRIHESPTAKKMKEFVRISEGMGHKLILGKTAIYPNELQRYLASVHDLPEYPVLSTMLLRCMQKARYDASCVGHFGLAEDEYLHFTSPIRRYPDLIVHRMLRKYCFQANDNLEQRANDLEKCKSQAEHASIRERNSQDAEYACEDMKIAEYMHERIGKTYSGIISSITSFGMYVKLENTVEGMIRVADLDDDYYEFNKDRFELVGQRRKKTYRIGMPIKVTVVDANKDAGTVDFAIAKKPTRFASGRTRFSNDRGSNLTRKPREDRKFGDKKFSDRKFFDKKFGDKKFGDKKFNDKKDRKSFSSDKRGKFDGSKPTRTKQGDKKPFFKGKSTGRKMTHGRKDA